MNTFELELVYKFGKQCYLIGLNNGGNRHFEELFDEFQKRYRE